MIEALLEWRDARQDIFSNISKISDENTERWKRLSEAEFKLMKVANDLGQST